jgi:hypothetical protein
MNETKGFIIPPGDGNRTRPPHFGEDRSASERLLGGGKRCFILPTIRWRDHSQSAGSCLIVQVEVRQGESSSPLLVVR